MSYSWADTPPRPASHVIPRLLLTLAPATNVNATMKDGTTAAILAAQESKSEFILKVKMGKKNRMVVYT